VTRRAPARHRWPDRLAALALGVAPARDAETSAVQTRIERDSTPVPDIGVAISRNVFSPARRAPAVAYRLSRTDPAAALGMESPELERIDPVVLGTALGATGTSFAMCSYADAPAIVVRVGDQLGPYTVVAIARGRVTFRDVDGSRLEVESPTSPDGELP
jgi:hypothetical protein